MQVRAAAADGKLRLSPAQVDGVAYYEDIRVTPLLRCEIEEMQVRSTLLACLQKSGYAMKKRLRVDRLLYGHHLNA